eukprot:m.131622 g.131622  ORF g.131622 m.131622 type:complete len:216 (-) comp13921_c0_seq2:109-756(-)
MIVLLQQFSLWFSFACCSRPTRFSCGFLGCHLLSFFVRSSCNLRLHLHSPGNIAIHSDNLSSLSIAKEAISKAATTLNVPIDIDDVCVAGSVIGIVQVMTEKIKQQIELLQQIDILRTLKEVALQEGDLSAMSEEYKMILQNEAQIMATHKSRPYYLQRLFGVLSDLFIDMRKAQGAPAKQHMPSLLELFDPYDPDQVANFFLHFAHEFDEAQDV